MLVRDIDQAVDVANAYAAEHLEIQTADASAVAARIVNAGAIFIGSHTPVSLGDYAAGSNHVLPTAGCACHSSGLSVRAFCRNMHVVTYSADALREVGGHVVALAEAENLPSHGAAVSDPHLAEGLVMPLPEWVPIRDDLRGFEPYGAPQIPDVINLNVNENPYPPERAGRRRHRRGCTQTRRQDSTAIPTVRRRALRTGARGLSRPRTDRRPRLGGQRLQRGHAADPAGVRRPGAYGAVVRADVLDVSRVRPRHPHPLGHRHPREDFTIDVDRALALIAAEQPDVVLLTSPNNPTGTALPLDTIGPSSRLRTGVVVVDEAYAEFRRAGTPTRLEVLDEFPRLLVTRTMSKAFALAGGRLGYVAADAAIIDALRIVRLPYHLSAVTQAVAVAALAHSDELLARVDEIRASRDELSGWLKEQGHEVAESDANFVLFGRFDDRHAIWQGLGRPRRPDTGDWTRRMVAGVSWHAGRKRTLSDSSLQEVTR